MIDLSKCDYCLTFSEEHHCPNCGAGKQVINSNFLENHCKSMRRSYDQFYGVQALAQQALNEQAALQQATISQNLVVQQSEGAGLLGALFGAVCASALV